MSGFVILAIDRLARDENNRTRPVGRVCRSQLDLISGVWGQSAELIDSVSAQSSRMVTLQREFAHRILEAIHAR